MPSPASTIRSEQIRSDAITTIKILDANVTTAKIADLNVTSAKLAASAVVSGKIAASAIDSASLFANAPVDTAALGAAQVTEAKLSDEVRRTRADLTMDDSSTQPTAVASRGTVLGTGNEGLVEALASPGMFVRVQVAASAYSHRGRLVNTGTQTSLTVPAAHATLPRDDIVTISDSNGAFGLLQGTAAASPADPVIGLGSIPIARVRVDAAVTSIVAGKITDLRERRSLAGAKLISGSVATAAVADLAITSEKLAAGAVIAGKIATGGVSAAGQFAAGVVDSTALGSSAVTAGKIGTGGISAAGQFAAGVVDSAALGTGAVIAGKIATGGVSAAGQFAAGVVDTAALGDLQVTNGKLAASAVTEAKISAGTITNASINASAAIASTKLATWTADRDAGGFKLANLAAPTAANDAARKTDVDAARQGASFKKAVRVASTANLTLSGTQTIDGVAVAAGERVLAKDQTTGSANGIYDCAAGAWTRSDDADTAAEIEGAVVWVEEGATNGDQLFSVATDAITLGTTAITWAQIGALGQLTAGAGLTKTGNTVDVGAGSGILVSADSVAADYGAAGSLTSIDAGDAAAAGTAAQLARIDHQHAVTSGAPVGFGLTAAEGAGAALARAAHVHPLGAHVEVKVCPTDVAAGATTNAFALEATPIDADDGLMLFLNGVALEYTQDFTISGTNVTFTANVAPVSGDRFQAFYFA